MDIDPQATFSSRLSSHTRTSYPCSAVYLTMNNQHYQTTNISIEHVEALFILWEWTPSGMRGLLRGKGKGSTTSMEDDDNDDDPVAS